ncbi:MAG: DUF438 domain-containing protein [Firmicutes bacterium]|nr:DUF438 domain-containing protein [Bacillota bacterium]
MSELIDGKSKRKEILRDIIKDLHHGKSPDEVKERFAKLIKNVNAKEISEMEDSLMAEGISENEIKRLCDVHVSIFKEALENELPSDTPPGHPVHTFEMENREIEKAIESLNKMLKNLQEGKEEALSDYMAAIKNDVDVLSEIDKHFLRKENQLFPLLENKGVQGPTKVMWQFHDDIRQMLKEYNRTLESGDIETVVAKGEELTKAISELIYKEENILFPMALETLGESDWVRVRRGEEEIGYTLVTPGDQWQPSKEALADLDKNNQGQNQGEIKLDTGVLTQEQLNLMLTNLPVDISFVDENDQVRYYSQGPERIFPRSPGIIGRDVKNCHPSSSVHVVEKIVDQFKKGTKDEAEFWLQLKGRFIHIRYFPIRDKLGNYRGVIEVAQDVTDIRALEGENRLLDW